MFGDNWRGIEAELAHHDHEVREGECTGEIKRPRIDRETTMDHEYFERRTILHDLRLLIESADKMVQAWESVPGAQLRDNEVMEIDPLDTLDEATRELKSKIKYCKRWTDLF